MRSFVVLVALAAAACNLGEIGEIPPGSGAADAGRSVGPVDASPGPVKKDATTGGGHDASVPDDTSDGDHASAKDAGGPEDAAGDTAEAAPDSGLDNAGDALQFDGSNYVSCGSLPLPTNFTLEAWINPATTTGETDIVAQDRQFAPQQQFRLGLESTGQLFFVMSDSKGVTHGLVMDGGDYGLQSSTTIPTGSWTHVAVTKNGAVFSVLIGASTTTTFTADATFSAGANVDFRIGGRVAGDGSSLDSGFDGTIDEVRLWSTPQDRLTIASNMTHEISTSASDFGDLLAYYRFDDGPPSTTASDTTTHYPGTLAGTPALPVWVISGAF
jgi:hypothetical protein